MEEGIGVVVRVKNEKFSAFIWPMALKAKTFEMHCPNSIAEGDWIRVIGEKNYEKIRPVTDTRLDSDGCVMLRTIVACPPPSAATAGKHICTSSHVGDVVLPRGITLPLQVPFQVIVKCLHRLRKELPKNERKLHKHTAGTWWKMEETSIIPVSENATFLNVSDFFKRKINASFHLIMQPYARPINIPVSPNDTAAVGSSSHHNHHSSHRHQAGDLPALQNLQISRPPQVNDSRRPFPDPVNMSTNARGEERFPDISNVSTRCDERRERPRPVPKREEKKVEKKEEKVEKKAEKISDAFRYKHSHEARVVEERRPTGMVEYEPGQKPVPNAPPSSFAPSTAPLPPSTRNGGFGFGGNKEAKVYNKPLHSMFAEQKFRGGDNFEVKNLELNLQIKKKEEDDWKHFKQQYPIEGVIVRVEKEGRVAYAPGMNLIWIPNDVITSTSLKMSCLACTWVWMSVVNAQHGSNIEWTATGVHKPNIDMKRSEHPYNIQFAPDRDRNRLESIKMRNARVSFVGQDVWRQFSYTQCVVYHEWAKFVKAEEKVYREIESVVDNFHAILLLSPDIHPEMQVPWIVVGYVIDDKEYTLEGFKSLLGMGKWQQVRDRNLPKLVDSKRARDRTNENTVVVNAAIRGTLGWTMAVDADDEGDQGPEVLNPKESKLAPRVEFNRALMPAPAQETARTDREPATLDWGTGTGRAAPYPMQPAVTTMPRDPQLMKKEYLAARRGGGNR